MTAQQITIETIIETVCKEYEIDPADITRKKWFSRRWGLSRKGPQKVYISKQVICYLCIRHLKMTHSFIGKRLNYNDHTCIKKNYNLTRNVMTVDLEFKERVERIENNLFKIKKPLL